MSQHAILSPSSAARWATCTASVGASAGIVVPDEGSEASRLGTCGHQILEDLLNDRGVDPQVFLGREFWFKGNRSGWPEDLDIVEPEHRVLVDQELIDAVVTAYNYVVEQAELLGGRIVAEQRVPIGHITGERGAMGTSDVVIEAGDTLCIEDLKLGRRRVDAYDIVQPADVDLITGEMIAEVRRPNLQLSMYALGVLGSKGAEHGFKNVRLVILQPFLNHVSEWSGSVEELMQVGAWLSERADETRNNPQFVPSEKACQWCRASGNCEAQTRMVLEAAVDGFEDVTTAVAKRAWVTGLGDAYAMIPLVKLWAQAVEERVYEALHCGGQVIRSDGQGYKLVEGRMAPRQWRDEAEAEETLRRMRLKDAQMYKRKLISPTDAEKLAKVKKPKKGEVAEKPALGTRQWNNLLPLITQGRGQPAVALLSDPRPAVAQASEGFEDQPPADNSDLF